jgi:hypothetical protein
MLDYIKNNKIQFFALVGSAIILIIIIELIRKKKLKEEYSLLWLFFSFVFIIFSLWREGLDYISKFIGIVYPPATLFLLLILGLFAILIHFSIIISELADKNKNLVQEIGLLKLEINNLIKKRKRK